MYTKLIETMKKPPAAYESTGIAFWDDEHISKGMLQNHLAADSDGASRAHGFIQKSVDWISSLPASGHKLLDLGCGPGIYAEKLHDKGYHVTGIDFSKRSIKYASMAAAEAGKDIEYIYQDYLTMGYQNEYDIAIMIYCDFGVLSPENRKSLLEKTYAALKPGGLFIVDVFAPAQYADFSNAMTVTFEDTGFWRPEPYLCIKRDKQYEGGVFLEQYTVLTEKEEQTYNLWNHAFTKAELAGDLQAAGFTDVEFFADAAGAPLKGGGTTLCAVGRKPQESV